jgi:hypothetical protein
MQTATARHLTVHATELIEVVGFTKAGRDISIYIVPRLAKDLAEAFALLPICQHLGHAYWHVRENQPAPCQSCGNKGVTRSAFEPEGGWPRTEAK